MDKIIERIRKLLALAADQSNPHVSAEALRKAQELMADHNLDEAAIDRASVKKEGVKSPFSISRLKMYESILVDGIMKAFGCDFVFEMGHSRSEHVEAVMTFYGPENRVKLASYAYEVLTRQLRRSRTEFVNAESSKLDGHAVDIFKRHGSSESRALVEVNTSSEYKKAKRNKLKKLGDDFCLGFVTEIQKKVVTLAVGDAEKALITSVAEDAATGRTEAKTDDKVHADAFYAGLASAKDAHLHRPMDGSNTRQSLLGDTKLIGNA